MPRHPEKLVAWAFAAAFGLSLLLGVVLRDQIACTLVEASGLTQIAPHVFADAPDSDEATSLVERASQRVASAFGASSSEPIVIFSDSSFWRGDADARTIVTPFRACIVIGSKARSVEDIAHEMARAEIARRAGFLPRRAQIPAWFEEGAVRQVDPVDAADAGKLTNASSLDLRKFATRDQFFNASQETLALREAAARQQVAQMLAPDGGAKALYAKLEQVRQGARFAFVFEKPAKLEAAEPPLKMEAPATHEKPDAPVKSDAAKPSPLAETPKIYEPAIPANKAQGESPDKAKTVAPTSLASSALPSATVGPEMASRSPEPTGGQHQPIAGNRFETDIPRAYPIEPPRIAQAPKSEAGSAPPVRVPAPRQVSQAIRPTPAAPDLPTSALASKHRVRPVQHFAARNFPAARFTVAATPRHVRPIAASPAYADRTREHETRSPHIEILHPQWSQPSPGGRQPLILSRRSFVEPPLWDKWAQSDAITMARHWRRMDTPNGLLYLARQRKSGWVCSTDFINGYCLCRRAGMRRGR